MPTSVGVEQRALNTIPLADSGALALLFHLNSEPWMNQPAYDEPAPLSAFKTLDGGGERIELPGVAGTTPLFELIRARRSLRDFADRELPLERLAALLYRSYGFIGIRGAGREQMHHRPVPSAGALFPLEIYVITRKVGGVADGLYHYAAWHHRLECLERGVAAYAMLADLQEQYYVAPANAIVFLTAVFPRTMKKYGPRGYRYVLLEAGHAAQNLCLLSAEQGLGTLCMGGFRDSAINRLLRLNPATEGAVYAVAIGQADGP